MKKIGALILFILTFNQLFSQKIITSDIDNFWIAYDSIIATKDTLKQYNFLNKLYFEKGSYGLKTIREVKDYTAKDYLDAINNFPLFWATIRENTFKSKVLAIEIETGIKQLKQLYPELKQASIYFTIGALRTNGTTIDSTVLIGTELAFADAQTVTAEFPKNLSHLKSYFATNPINNVSFLNVHEFVHTQQKNHDYILLYRSVYEGIAEFVAVKATGEVSTAPAIAFGKLNNDRIRAKFSKALFSAYAINYWLYNNTNNEFKMRDLGYYVGYAICEKYYEQAKDKRKAIKDMIELDYGNEKAFAKYINTSKYFDKDLKILKADYESDKPTVLSIKEFKNGSTTVDPNIKIVSVTFSQAMNPNQRGFEFGPLGEANALMVKKFIGFSEDGKTMTFEVALTGNKKFQIEITDKFRSLDGVPLVPYLIDIKTAQN
jgi:Predicted Zn-dependent protease (DUF2268)